MTKFDYRGFDKAGARVSGGVEADSAEQAKQILATQGIILMSLQAENSQQATNFLTSTRVGLEDVEFLTAELSLLLDSGLKIDRGIELLRKNTEKPALVKLLQRISDELRAGKQLSEILSLFPDCFDSLYINLVSIGEATGKLPMIFKQLAENLAFRRELQKKVIHAITYPMIVLFVCLSSIVFVFNYVVPNMSEIFEQQKDLPAYTVFLISTSNWFIQYQLWLLFALLVSALTLFHFRKAERIKAFWQWLSFRLPLVNSALVLVDRIRFNSGLSMMLQAGLPIDKAMDLACGSMKTMELKSELNIASNKIKRGERLSETLGQTRLYPSFFSSLLAVGEESGELAKVFDEIAKRSQREFADWVNRFTSLLEPLLILVMGGIVGSVVVIMMLSITSASDVGL